MQREGRPGVCVVGGLWLAGTSAVFSLRRPHTLSRSQLVSSEPRPPPALACDLSIPRTDIKQAQGPPLPPAAVTGPVGTSCTSLLVCLRTPFLLALAPQQGALLPLPGADRSPCPFAWSGPRAQPGPRRTRPGAQPGDLLTTFKTTCF